ncbi:MAG: DUF115 domain-containing protein [Myxococcales bacterium]|nr:DUF115 domain-containing protein [Myxococcales bacterium]
MRCDACSWAEQVASAPADVIVVFGLGAHVEVLAATSGATVIAFPARGESLSAAPLGGSGAALDPYRIADEDGTPPVLTVGNVAALRRLLAEALRPRQCLRVVGWPEAMMRDPAGYRAMFEAAQRGVALATTTQRTLDVRLERWIGHTFCNLPWVVGRHGIADLAPALAGWPAIIVGAGPSLDRNVRQLRRASSRARIIAVNSAVGALERAGVRADLIVSVELLDVSEQLRGLSLNADVPRALSLSAHPALHRTRDAEVYPFFEQVEHFAPLAEAAGLLPTVPSGGSVASSALALAFQLGAGPLIFVGQDLAYSGERPYARGTSFDEMRVVVDDVHGAAHLSNLDVKRRIGASVPEADTTREHVALERVRAWGQDTAASVWSTHEFNYFRYTLESWAARTPPGVLYNATEGGAHIEGFVERPLAEVLDALPLRFDCAPLRAPAARRPIDAVRLREALARAHDEAARVVHLANGAARSHDDDDVFATRAALVRSPLVAAACRRPLVETLGDPARDFTDLFNAVAHNGRRLARALRGVERRLPTQPAYGKEPERRIRSKQRG